MRPRCRQQETASARVAAIWLVFYAVMIVSALMGRRPEAGTPEIAATIEGERKLQTN